MTFGIYKKPKKLFAFGDIHGDFGLLKLLLSDCAKVMDEKDNWIGGNAVVIFVGDLVDRSRQGCLKQRINTDGGIIEKGVGEIHHEELKIFQLIAKLNKQSKINNDKGFILPLFGNHEIMNFNGLETRFSSEFCLMNDKLTTSKHSRNHNGRQSRFLPKDDRHIGDIHQAITEAYQNTGFKKDGKVKPINVIAKFGDWIFVHGGIVKNFLTAFNIDIISNNRINGLSSNNGERIIQTINFITDLKFNGKLVNSKLSTIWNKINNQDGPVWTRRWGQDCCDNEGNDCADFKQTLQYMFKDTRTKYKLAMAHCTQINRGKDSSSNKYYKFFDRVCYKNKNITAYYDKVKQSKDGDRYPGITFDCGETMWRLDAGMSRGFDFPHTINSKEMLEARRPQGLLIIMDRNKEYRYIIKSNKDLER